MKHLIILADGSADWACPSLGGKTLYQHAQTPNMDLLAKKGRCGRLKTVPDGFHPGSEVANSSILGYDQHKVYEGRGSLEAASIGYEMRPDDMAMRCNIVCLEGDILKNHSAGHITTDEADVLIQYLDQHLGNDTVHFYTGVQYRHLLVVKGGDKRVKCVPPHDVPLQPWRPLLVQAECPEAQPTADLLNDLILKSQELLQNHPMNLQRKAAGMDPANSIWPWSPGFRPSMEPLTVTYPQIKKGSVISAVDLIKGIGHYAGLRNIDVPGATGLYNTNYTGKVEAALKALKEEDFVYLHIEGPDEAGHEGDVFLKLRTIEDIDKLVVGPIVQEIQQWDEPVAIAILPDHPTPCALRTHTNEPIPFLICAPGLEPDAVQQFDEVSCVEGAFGLMEGNQFMNAFMSI
ncbi:MAG: cofactor-independent phosphoglycerate mutase [Bacteroidales bacterium]|nr:cofactor-independent phosphoglycerate mutase [Bacteroidales bacterium]